MERALIAVLVARLGGYVTVTEQEMEAASTFTLRLQQNTLTQEIAATLRESSC